MEFVSEFIDFLTKNFKLIGDNWSVFLIHAILVSVIVFVITQKVTKAQYDSLPEREDLKNQVLALEQQNTDLQKEIHELKTTSNLLQGAHTFHNPSNVGQLISNALHETKDA